MVVEVRGDHAMPTIFRSLDHFTQPRMYTGCAYHNAYRGPKEDMISLCLLYRFVLFN